MVWGRSETVLAIAALVAAILVGFWHWFPEPRPPVEPPSEARISPAPPAAPPAAGSTSAAPPPPTAAPPAAATVPDSRNIPDASQAQPTREAGPAQTTEAVPPSFDVVRVEPNGDSVIAGRGTPGATVELLRNGEMFARVPADASGLFALVAPPLPPGSSELVIQSTSPDGRRARSRDSVTVVIAPDRKARPLVALTSPERPTVVLSSPDQPEVQAPAAQAQAPPPAAAQAPPASAAAPAARPAPPAAAEAAPPAPRPGVRIEVVESQGGGRLFVSGRAAPGATVRLYLNDSLVAPGAASADGRLAFTIERGVRPGGYAVRLDDVDPVSGDVRSRAEVPFTMPLPAAVAETIPAPGSASPTAPRSPAMPPSPGLQPPETSPGTTTSTPLPPTPPLPVIAQPEAAPPADARSDRPAVAAAPPVSSRAAPVASDVPPGTDLTNLVVVPEINTAIVARGDNLWRISRRVYGQGVRYTVIYGANQPQIRDPARIYPGQVFVLPAGQDPSR